MGITKDLTREQCFILDVLRGRADIFLDLDWQQIIKIAREQKVMGFIAHAARQQGWTSFLSQDIKAVFEDALLEYRFLNEEKKMQFKKISALLGHEGVSLIPLKGMYLSFFIYEGMPYRGMDDIDILVPKEDVQRVIHILEKEGFEKVIYPLRYRWHAKIIEEIFEKDHPYWNRLGRNGYADGSGLNVDLHWEPYYVISGQRITFDLDSFWKSDVPIRHLLFLSAHTADQYTPSLVQILDIALCMRKIPGVLSLLEEETRDWPPLAREQLFKLCRMVEEIWLTATPVSNLSGEALDLLKDFFNRAGKKERYDPYSPVLSIRQKIIFLIGYLIPEPSYYRENEPWVMYKRHWSFILEKISRSFSYYSGL